MRELEAEGTYADQVEFVIVPADQTAESHDALVAYGLSSHGLVTFDAAGEPREAIDGHTFGRPEIEAAIAKTLN